MFGQYLRSACEQPCRNEISDQERGCAEHAADDQRAFRDQFRHRTTERDTQEQKSPGRRRKKTTKGCASVSLPKGRRSAISPNRNPPATMKPYHASRIRAGCMMRRLLILRHCADLIRQADP